MLDALRALGLHLEENLQQEQVTVHGCGGRFPVQGAELFLGNAGTAMRYACLVISPFLADRSVLPGCNGKRPNWLQWPCAKAVLAAAAAALTYGNCSYCTWYCHCCKPACEPNGIFNHLSCMRDCLHVRCGLDWTQACSFVAGH